MKTQKLLEGVMVFAVLAVLIAGIYGLSTVFRKMEADTTGITVHRPEPGYVCFLANRETELALSCVKE